MKKKYLKFIILIIILVAAIGIIIFINNKNKMVYNDESALGNTAGNLNNGGLFCEYNDRLYFANPYDGNKLYSMNPDCSDAKKLNGDSIAYINVYGKYIYYAKNNFSPESVGVVFRGALFGVYRTNLNGENSVPLYDKLSGILSLSGNNIYYQHYDDKTALTLYKIRIDGKDNTELSDIEYNPASIYNGKIYFSNISGDHNIKVFDTATDSTYTFYEGNTYLATADNGYVYFIDISNGYALKRINMQTKTVELLNDGRCINYNVYKNKLFYLQEGDNAGLYRMNVDGSQKELVSAGDFTNVNCTSKYTFFQYFNNQGTLYRVPTTERIDSVEQITIQ